MGQRVHHTIFFKKTIKMTADNSDNGRIMLAVA